MKHTELHKAKERMQREIEAYTKQQDLKKDRDDDATRLQDIKQKQFAIIADRKSVV